MAAASASMQAFVGRPVNGLSGSINLPKRSANLLRIRSMAKENEKEIDSEQPSLQSTPAGVPKPSQPTPPPPNPKVSTKFEDILAFSGPGPERINGRLAMIGFVTAMGVELAKGQDLFSQINHGGFQLFLATSVVLSLASLIPLFKGVRAESETGGFMNSNAELWNGRFAMVGLVALAFTEYVIGGALV